MTSKEFWGSTPRQFDARLVQYLAEQEREDYRAGVIASLVANSIPSSKKRKAYKPEDFFPSLRRRKGG